MQRSKAQRAVGVVAASICMGVAGCGGKEEEKNSGSQKTPAAERTSAPKVEMSELKYTPATVTVKRGATISVPNVGAIQHDLKLREGGEVVGGTELVDAGQSADLKVDVEPGTYEMFCSVPGHEASGMKGEFTVE